MSKILVAFYIFCFVAMVSAQCRRSSTCGVGSCGRNCGCGQVFQNWIPNRCGGCGWGNNGCGGCSGGCTGTGNCGCINSGFGTCGNSVGFTNFGCGTCGNAVYPTCCNTVGYGCCGSAGCGTFGNSGCGVCGGCECVPVCNYPSSCCWNNAPFTPCYEVEAIPCSSCGCGCGCGYPSYLPTCFV